MRTTLYDYCLTHGSVDLLAQWHPLKNLPLTPQQISYGSKRKIWWRCERGHEWQAIVYTRTSNNISCPYCSGRRVAPGENDLASQKPGLAAEWHPTWNVDCTPDKVSVGSHRLVWWRCERGHEWRASVKSRAGSGAGCPICANKALLPGENDLATTHPDLARQWHPTRNGKLTPRDLVAGTRRRVWWRCEAGHAWQAAVASRANGAGCPVCTGKKVMPGENDLASYKPELAAGWHPTRNGKLTPSDVTPSSNRKVWWLCPLGHEYQAVVSARAASGTDCPYCAGRRVLPGFNDLATLEPETAAEWHPTLNGALTPEMVTVGSHKKVWWECAAGHAWTAVVYSRVGRQKTGCPICAGRAGKPRGVWRYRDAAP